MSTSPASDNSDDVEGLLAHALSLCRAGRFPEADTTLRRLLAIEPRHSDALHLLGVISSQLGNHTEGLRHLEAALGIVPQSADVHNSRGNVLAALKRFDEALASFETAIALDPRAALAFSNRGNVYRELRRFQAAVQSYDQAITLDPADAECFYNRAGALRELRRLEEALAGYDKAIELRPDYAEAFSNRGVVLQDLNRVDEAVKSYERASALNPDFSEAWCNRGNALQQMNRFAEAVTSYDKAIASMPGFAKAWNYRGAALQQLNRLDAAVASYETALASSPDYADAHVNLGNVLVTLGRHQEAIPHYEQALAVRPDDPQARDGLDIALTVPILARSDGEATGSGPAAAAPQNHAEVHNNLGVALLELGRLNEAARAFENSIAAAPRNIGAYLNLATARPVTATDPHFGAMRDLARDMTALATEDRIKLHFALAKAFADVRRIQESAQHLIEGNALKRRHIVYDEAATLALLDRIRKTFTAELMQSRRGAGDPSFVPVFIVGMPRSGTTLVEQILASHPQVFGAGELDEMHRLAAGIRGRDWSKFPEAVASMSGGELQRLGQKYVRAVGAMAPAAQRVTDKMPVNFAYAGLIHLAMPNARIIHVQRDARDTALSCFSILFEKDSVGFTYDLTELGRYHRAYQALMAHWRKVLPQGVMLDVQYEEVVDDLEAQARAMVAYCGLEWDDACLAFYETERSVRTASAIQVRQPIYRSSIGRWREYEDVLQPFLRVLAEPEAPGSDEQRKLG